MWLVKDIQDPSQRSTICKEIIAALPNWFGIEEANKSYIEGTAKEDAFVVFDGDGRALGMLSLRFPYPNNADIYWLGVVPDQHRSGIGKVLFEAAVARAKERGCETMTVETLGDSSPDEGYQRTRMFYSSMGFKPLFELRPYGPENPLLYMMRPL